MKILFATAHFGFLRNFESGLNALAERGHRIHLTADRRDNLGGMRTIERLAAAHPDAFTWSVVPPPKTHVWRALGTVLRLSLDYWRYLDARYDQAPALRARAARQIPPVAAPLAQGPLARIGTVRRMLTPVLRAFERVLPASPHADQILDEATPDLVVVTPLLYFGSQQVDHVRAARRRGLPTMLGVGSWDHLTTKGLIHEIPDVVTVWNESQREEASQLHRVPPETVKVTGSPAYDHWFTAAPSVDRETFCASLGLPSDRPLLLYVCSSPFITPYEVGFVRQWLGGIRASADPALRRAAVVIRPHPQNADQWAGVDLAPHENVVIWPRAGANPVDQAARNDYYHSMFHSSAVVGVNTSALIESGIVGRPVFTIRAAEFAETQEGTLHFRHLERVEGGLLSVADSLTDHCDQLSTFLAQPAGASIRGRAFIGAFVRPHGLGVPAARVFAEVVEELGHRARQPARQPPVLAGMLRYLLYPAAVLAHEATRRRGSRQQGDGATRRSRRLLFVMASPEYLRFFDDTVRELADRGVDVRIAVNTKRDVKQARIERFEVDHPKIRFVGIMPPRSDMWAPLVAAVRGTMDFVRYLDARFADAPVLRARMKRKCLPRSLQWLDRIGSLPRATVGLMLRWLRRIERAAPVATPVAAFLREHRPDVVVVTPLVDAASPQVDVVRAARALRIPTAACIASWDNLTNKGLLRVHPDLVTVWNETQAREAVELHGIASDRVAMTGAQPFDRWFEKRPSRSREAFCATVDLDPARPIILFTGSSFFISGEQSELPFVCTWMEALRGFPHAALRGANVLVRPHPYNADQWADADLSDLGPVAVWPRGRYNPTDERNRTDFYDSLFHCDAVVGVNTSAMIEAAIVGRPVHAVLTSDFAGTQEGTLHFRYLLPENGGFLRVGRTFDDHFRQLVDSLTAGATTREETARFVRSFVRPLGLEHPCAPILGDALERLANRGALTPVRVDVAGGVLRVTLWLPVLVWSTLGAWSSKDARKRWRMGLHRQRKRSLRLVRALGRHVPPRRLRRAMRSGWRSVRVALTGAGRRAARAGHVAKSRMATLANGRSSTDERPR